MIPGNDQDDQSAAGKIMMTYCNSTCTCKKTCTFFLSASSDLLQGFVCIGVQMWPKCFSMFAHAVSSWCSTGAACFSFSSCLCACCLPVPLGFAVWLWQCKAASLLLWLLCRSQFWKHWKILTVKYVIRNAVGSRRRRTQVRTNLESKSYMTNWRKKKFYNLKIWNMEGTKPVWKWMFLIFPAHWNQFPHYFRLTGSYELEALKCLALTSPQS